MDQPTLLDRLDQIRAEFQRGVASITSTIHASLCGADVDGQPCVRESGHVGPCNYRWPGGLPPA